MGDAERAGHDDVVLEFIRPPLLQSDSRVGLHDATHIHHKLADAGTDLASTDADDHTLGAVG
jgi:hypothetical protein